MNTRLDLLRFLVPNGVGVELGVCDGQFSLEILKHWNCRKLYLIDVWRHQANYFDGCNVDDNYHERRYQSVKTKMKPFGNRVSIIRELTHLAKDLVPDGLDFVYIDANHAFDNVVQDIEDWYPKVKSGGWLAGHDYVNGSVGHGPITKGYQVPLAVDQLVKKYNWQLILMDKGDCSWAVQLI